MEYKLKELIYSWTFQNACFSVNSWRFPVAFPWWHFALPKTATKQQNEQQDFNEVDKSHAYIILFTTNVQIF